MYICLLLLLLLKIVIITRLLHIITYSKFKKTSTLTLEKSPDLNFSISFPSSTSQARMEITGNYPAAHPHVLITSLPHTHTRAAGGRGREKGGDDKNVTPGRSRESPAVRFSLGESSSFTGRRWADSLSPCAPFSLPLSLPHTHSLLLFSHTLARTHTHTRTYNARCAGPPAHERCFGPAQQVDRSAPRPCKHGSRGTFSPSCEPNRTEPSPLALFSSTSWLLLFFLLEGHLADGKSVGRTQLRREPRRCAWRRTTPRTGRMDGSAHTRTHCKDNPKIKFLPSMDLKVVRKSE